MTRHRHRWGSALLALAAWAASVPAAGAAPAGPAVYHYSVRGKGNTSDLEAFAAAAAETYADPRGWNLAGSVRFERVPDGGDFTLWLAADRLMSTFGGACDVVWSCRNGDNVVINEDRWLGASPAWTAAGETLRDYRHMVVNHETGHWLGFGHATCPSPGAPAPVMQQQSMGLQGCAPNPWPVARERTTAAAHARTVAAPDETTTTTTTEPPPPPLISEGVIADEPLLFSDHATEIIRLDTGDITDQAR